MKKGFTILELLVASLLLGMLVTILTMIFNQSSIAWRTGVASVADLDSVRGNIAAVRDEADNLYVWRNDANVLLSIWNDDGDLRSRAISVDGESSAGAETALAGISSSTTQRNLPVASVGSATAGSAQKTYIVNVNSAGPDREFETWDDIWSYPDDFEM